MRSSKITVLDIPEIDSWEKDLGKLSKSSNTKWNEKKEKFVIKNHDKYSQLNLAVVLGISRSYLQEKIAILKLRGKIL